VNLRVVLLCRFCPLLGEISFIDHQVIHLLVRYTSRSQKLVITKWWLQNSASILKISIDLPTDSVDIGKAMFEVGPYIDSDLAANII